ncbi:hypothetical protein FB45DRAFT_874921 [Roridomyces roridus]|uniref:DUF6924 domain-containing protein n=1 Tax=Roridomyces roridus TaxID=1738132 RepID=A0AAD7FCU5_9AGAR|nr:hypothetical protein FB45DRAFT_874921 [Roridomyces roridus]
MAACTIQLPLPAASHANQTLALHQPLNRALLLIQDFEYGDYPENGTWVLLTSETLPSTAPVPTKLPITSAPDNTDFASASLVEINTFMRAKEQTLAALDLSSRNWVVIDQSGLDASTCLVCEQVYDYTEDDKGNSLGLTAQFPACRAPFEEAWIMMANLDISNMDFEEYVDQEKGQDGEGVWTWSTSFSEEGQQRDKVLKELRDGGYSD